MTNAAHDGAAPAANSGEVDNRRDSLPDASSATHHQPRLLPRDVVIAQWPKGLRSDEVELALRPAGRGNVIDLRTLIFDRDGNLLSAKGFSAPITHLSKLVRALVRAEQLATRLGLIKGGE